MPVLLSITEVDDALTRARRIPEDERGDLWESIVDALLDRRAALVGADANLEGILRDRATAGR